MSEENFTFPPSTNSKDRIDGGFRVPHQQGSGRTVEFDAVFAAGLVEAARKAAESAYAPYSRFRVGAAVLMADDAKAEIFRGCNVENASYGATICAERSAIFGAVAAGFRRIRMLALSTLDSLEGPLVGRSPCGVCRQVISEFADENSLVLVDTAEEEIVADLLTIEVLLPFRFSLGPESR